MLPGSQQLGHAIAWRLDDVQNGDLRHGWNAQQSEPLRGGQGVLGFVHRHNDLQAPCPLLGRSPPSSADDQDRARRRMENALAHAPKEKAFHPRQAARAYDDQPRLLLTQGVHDSDRRQPVLHHDGKTAVTWPRLSAQTFQESLSLLEQLPPFRRQRFPQLRMVMVVELPATRDRENLQHMEESEG
jgi:hypothetical protein